MLRLALATLRTRWVSFLGAFVALALGTGVIATMALTMAATLGTPFSGPQRFADAPTVVLPHNGVRFAGDEDGEEHVLDRPAGIPPELFAKIAATGRAVPDRTFPVRVQGGPSDQVGHPWSAAEFTPYRLVAGRAPRAADEVVVGGGAKASVGRTLPVTTLDGVRQARIVGVTGSAWFEHAVFFSDDEAARISPRVDAVVAFGKAGEVRGAVGGAAQVLTGDERGKADPDTSGGRDGLLNAQGMAGTSTGIVVSVAIFLVVVTFAFVVDQRRRELALLRTVGATPDQVRKLVLAEAAVVGLAASFTGCVLGTLAVPVLGDWMVDQGVAPEWFTIEINPIPLVIAFLLGLVSAVAGAAAVSLRAGRVRPTEALREAVVDRKGMTALRWLLGLALLTGGVVTSVVIAQRYPIYAGNLRKYAAVPLLLVGGFALFAPVVMGPLTRLATRPMARMGAGAMVVRENLLASRRRTAATVTPVVIAIGLSASVLSAQASADDARVAQARQQTRAQFVVVPTGIAVLNQRTADAVRTVPGVDVATVTPTRALLSTPQGQFVDTLSADAVEPAAMASVENLRLDRGSASGLADDFLIVNQRLARSDDLSVGSPMRVTLPDGSTAAVRVAAITKDGIAGDVGYLSSAHAVGGLPSRIEVRVRPGTDPAAVAGALRNATRGQAARVVPIAALTGAVDAQQKQHRSAAYSILAIALVYSCIAIANVLMMAAAGRRREIAALNMAGATRRQTLRFIAAESLMVVLIGLVLSSAATAAVLAGQWAALDTLVGGTSLHIPWLAILEITALCAATAVAAATLPAWQTLRGRVIEQAALRD
ncbi:ABC transporter permease [Actinomadura oligospora]|uniref:ABC transporter permease n=1 Tax=Actinomadura oligospora TaxID=111804 RepID=UPI00047DE689|nr:FtsX-like permease family protein [Actinomadura oligospora]